MRTAGFYSFRRFSLNFQHCCVSTYSFGLARNFACGQLDSDHNSQTEDKQEEEDQDTPLNASIKPGQFVGLVKDNSTYTQHRVWIAQVKSLANQEASLLWYKKVAANTYKLELTSQIERNPKTASCRWKCRPSKTLRAPTNC